MDASGDGPAAAARGDKTAPRDDKPAATPKSAASTPKSATAADAKRPGEGRKAKTASKDSAKGGAGGGDGGGAKGGGADKPADAEPPAPAAAKPKSGKGKSKEKKLVIVDVASVLNEKVEQQPTVKVRKPKKDARGGAKKGAAVIPPKVEGKKGAAGAKVISKPLEPKEREKIDKIHRALFEPGAAEKAQAAAFARAMLGDDDEKLDIDNVYGTFARKRRGDSMTTQLREIMPEKEGAPLDVDSDSD